MTTPNPANPNWPLIYDQVALNVGGNDTTTPPVWTDITDRVASRSISSGRSSSIDHTEAAEVTYLLRDRDEAFNPANTASPYYGQMLPNRRIRTLAMWADATAKLAGNILYGLQLTDAVHLTSGAASFENGTTGDWTAGGTNPPTLANSTTHAFDGTHALMLTLPTGAGGQAVTRAQAPVPTKFWGLAVGRTYSVSLYVWAPVGVTAIALAVGGSPTLTGSSHLTTTTTGAWERLFCTFTCNDASNNMPIVYATGATTAGQTVWVDAVQIEFAAAVSAYSTTGPTITPLFIGYVDRWPTSWTHQGLYSWAQLGCTDDLGTFGLTTFVDPVYHQSLVAGPAALYPMTEPAGATAAGDVAGGQAPSLQATLMAGGGASTLTFAADDGPTGVAQQVVQLVNNTATPTVGAYLSADLTASPVGGTSGVTLLCWFKLAAAPSSIVTIAGLWNGVNDYLTMGVGTDGVWRIYARLPGMATETVFPAGAVPVADGKWHFGAVIASNSGGTYTLVTVVDDASWGTTTVSGTSNPAGANSAGPYRAITVGAEPKGRVFNGSLCYAGVLPYAAAWGDLATGIAVAGANGFAGDSTLTRFARIGIWFGHLVLGAGSTTVTMQGAQVHNGKTVQQIFGDIVDTEGGALYVTVGQVELLTRNLRQLQTVPAVTFGEDASSGEVPYEQDFTTSLDLDSVYNDVTVEQANGVSIRVADAASQKANFARSYSLTVYSDDPAEITDHANALLSFLSTPVERIGTLTVEAGNRGARDWAGVLTANRQQRVIKVNRRLSNGVLTSGLYTIDKVTHDIGPGPTWRLSLEASPLGQVASWILGDSVRGVLGSTTIAGW